VWCARRCLVYNWFTDYIPTVFHTTSVWLTVALAAQRYLYVCYSVVAKRFCTVTNIVKARRAPLATRGVAIKRSGGRLKQDLDKDFFTARCYASAVLAMGLCLCLSVTSRSSTITAKRRITQTTPHDSPGTLVFFCQRSARNSTGVTPYEGAECRWGGSKSATFD